MLNVATRFRLSSQSKIVLDTNTAVNTFAIRPITSVTANPFTGPVPNKNKNAHETTVVTCVSTIVRNALLNPASSAAATPLPARHSSRTRSKISTLLSTAMPIVKMIPAIPGSVSVASK